MVVSHPKRLHTAKPPATGLLVYRTERSSWAEAAGLQRGDQLVKVSGVDAKLLRPWRHSQKKTHGKQKPWFFIGLFWLLYIKIHRRSGTLGWFWLEITYELTEAEVNMTTKSKSYTVDNISPSVYIFMCTHRWYVSMQTVLNIWYYDIAYIYIHSSIIIYRTYILLQYQFILYTILLYKCQLLGKLVAGQWQSTINFQFGSSEPPCMKVSRLNHTC